MRFSCFVALFAAVLFAQSGPVPVEREPNHHLAFENQALRVIEPRIPPHAVTLEHLHSHDDVTICIHGSSVRGKSPGGEWSRPGEPCAPGRAGFTEYSSNPRSHTVENVGDGEYHLTLVENLRSSGWTTSEALNVPGLKMERENRSFRVYSLAASSPAHTHPVPTVVILVSGSAMEAGKHLDQPGQSAFVPAGTEHRTAAEGQTQLMEVEVR